MPWSSLRGSRHTSNPTVLEACMSCGWVKPSPRDDVHMPTNLSFLSWIRSSGIAESKSVHICAFWSGLRLPELCSGLLDGGSSGVEEGEAASNPKSRGRLTERYGACHFQFYLKGAASDGPILQLQLQPWVSCSCARAAGENLLPGATLIRGCQPLAAYFCHYRIEPTLQGRKTYYEYWRNLFFPANPALEFPALEFLSGASRAAVLKQMAWPLEASLFYFTQ